MKVKGKKILTLKNMEGNFVLERFIRFQKTQYNKISSKKLIFPVEQN